MIFIEIFLICFLGLILGSFATAITYRSPRGIPWAFGSKSNDTAMSAHRSACPVCKAVLGLRDLIPLFSWLLSRGKCRHCETPIGYKYPAIEMTVLLSCLIVYAFKGWSVEGFIIIGVVPFLVALFAIDLEFMILPDELVAIVAGFGLIRLLFHDIMALDANVTEYLLGGLVFGLSSWGLRFIVSKLLKKEAMGLGDVKFFVVAGLWLGIAHLSLFCIISGLLLIIIAPIWQRIVKKEEIAFGPALILAFFGLLLFDGSILF